MNFINILASNYLIFKSNWKYCVLGDIKFTFLTALVIFVENGGRFASFHWIDIFSEITASAPSLWNNNAQSLEVLELMTISN